MRERYLKITYDDLAPELPTEPLVISEEDVVRAYRAAQRGSVTVTLDDIRNSPAAVAALGLQGMAPRLQIALRELPADLNHATTECYHGTSLSRARKIVAEGFRVGPGAKHGSGIYFSVGGIRLARSYLKSKKPCIIRARIDWGRVAYLDADELPSKLKGSGNSVTKAAFDAGYDSLITKSGFSAKKPAIGIVLQLKGAYVTPPRIEVIELLDPSGKPLPD